MRQKVVGAAAGRVVIQRTRPPSLDPVRRPPAVGGRVRRSHPWRRCTCSTCAWCRSNTAAHAKGHVRTAHMCIAMAGHSVQAWRSCRSRSCSFRRSRTPCGYRTRSCCPRATHQQPPTSAQNVSCPHRHATPPHKTSRPYLAPDFSKQSGHSFAGSRAFNFDKSGGGLPKPHLAQHRIPRRATTHTHTHTHTQTRGQNAR